MPSVNVDSRLLQPRKPAKVSTSQARPVAKRQHRNELLVGIDCLACNWLRNLTPGIH